MSLDFLRRILEQVQGAVDDGYYREFARTHTAPEPAPSLSAAIRRDAPWAFIAEAKPGSPQAGRLADDDAALQRLVATYRDYGVTGISVLTERETFNGSLELLQQTARPSDDEPRVPVLMKDFVVHDDQLAAARSAGASAVLLLQRVIQRGATPWDHPDDAIAAAHGHGLEVLLEVDDGQAFEHAATTQADILGINNRDLGTLEMDPDRAIDILRHRLHLVPDTPVLSLSGIENRADVLANQQGAATGVLVGTRLMTTKDPRATLRALRGLAHVKCCGAGHGEDPPESIRALAGADAVGVVVKADAPRQRDPEDARRLFDRLPQDQEHVLVTTHPEPHELAALVEQTHATHLQWQIEATPDQLQELKKALPPTVSIIALLRLDEKTAAGDNVDETIRHAKSLTPHAGRLLLDAKPKQGDPPGGTGHTTDWRLAAGIVKALRPYPVVLAGGLDPDNIQAALRTVRPWGVDVSSGTETPKRPGQKDPVRVRALLQNARRVLNLGEEKDPTEVDRLRVL